MASASVADLSPLNGWKRSDFGNAPTNWAEGMRHAAVVASVGDNFVRHSCNPRSPASTLLARSSQGDRPPGSIYLAQVFDLSFRKILLY